MRSPLAGASHMHSKPWRPAGQPQFEGGNGGDYERLRASAKVAADSRDQDVASFQCQQCDQDDPDEEGEADLVSSQRGWGVSFMTLCSSGRMVLETTVEG